ncbi:MAG TPA: hypothetical protein VEH29_15395 [Acidimicrobiales bacterium]|nr:hypothetical protein [Acidimicrobiales bacterium]
MRFKVGFLLGCAAGAWAASKASQLRRTDGPRADWPRVASSRADAVNAEATAERVRALGDLARERFTGFLDSPLGGMARARVVEMLSSSAGHGSSARRRSG